MKKMRKTKNGLKQNSTLVIILTALMVLGIVLSGCENPAGDNVDNTDNRLPAPGNLSATVDSSSSTLRINLTWTPVSNAAYYAIYRSTDSTWTNYINLISNNTSTVYTDSSSNLNADTTYYYKVGAKRQLSSDSLGKLSESVEVHILPSGNTDNLLPAPVNLNATADSSSSTLRVNLTWIPVPNAVYYAIYRTTDGTWSDYILLANSVSTTTYTDSSTTLIADTTYYYKVGARRQSTSDPVGELSESAEVHVLPSVNTSDPLPAPTNLRVATSTSSSNPILTWTPVPDAVYYAIYRSIDSTWSDYILLANSVLTTTYADTSSTLIADTTYYYKVGAKRQYANDPVGDLSESVSIYILFSGNRGIYASALSESSIKITWNAFTGASKYRVYRGNSSSNMEPVTYVNAPSTEYTDTSLSPSTTYYYRIAVVDSNEREGFISSDYNNATTQSAPAVGGIYASALSESSIKITWNAFAGASKYRVYRGNSSASSNMVPVEYVDAPLTEYTDTSLEPRTTYYYRIAYVDTNSNEGLLSSNYDYATTMATATPPGNLTATVNGRNITLEWDIVEGASNYYIYAAFNENGPYAMVDSFSASQGTVYHVTTLTQWSGVPLSGSTTYYFKVSTSLNGTKSNPASATTGP